MLREALRDRVSLERDFRWRGHEVSRLENLSDAVFAFALTLLVVSVEVPASFDDLLQALARFPGFAISFVFLMMIWFYHYLFFRRYGLQDGFTIAVNGLLLFVVLFYVYPMRFLIGLLASVMFDGGSFAQLRGSEWVALMVIYGLGFAAVYGVLALLARHAWRRRDDLELSPYEAAKTRELVGSHLIMVGAGLSSAGIALLLPPYLAGLAGWTYSFLFPAHWIHSSRVDRRARELLEAEAAQSDAGDGDHNGSVT